MRRRRGRLCPLRLGAALPHSERDFFVLNLCRARADAILTSAQNVRGEPALSHDLAGPWAPALAAYRAALGKHGAPLCAILTRTGELPEQHPIWSNATRKLLLTSEELAETLRARWAGRAEVVGLQAPSARAACAYLRDRGAALVSVEAGPSSAAALYETPPVVEELLLTVWEDAPADQTLLADALPEDARCSRASRARAARGTPKAGTAFASSAGCADRSGRRARSAGGAWGRL